VDAFFACRSWVSARVASVIDPTPLLSTRQPQAGHSPEESCRSSISILATCTIAVTAAMTRNAIAICVVSSFVAAVKKRAGVKSTQPGGGERRPLAVNPCVPRGEELSLRGECEQSSGVTKGATPAATMANQTAAFLSNPAVGHFCDKFRTCLDHSGGRDFDHVGGLPVAGPRSAEGHRGDRGVAVPARGCRST
jgi:hypothetical protein